MNTSPSPAESSVEVLASNKVGGSAYGALVLSVGIIVLLTTILVASYLCTGINTNMHLHPAPAPALDPRRIADGGADIERGLDEAALGSYPKVQYSELLGRSGKGSGTATCCSICLADYKDEDEIRQLPECGHYFHLECVNPWLRLHASCPVCRTSPLPTQLAGGVPLARHEI